MRSTKARGTRGVVSVQQVGCGRFPKTEEAPPSNGGAGPQMFGLKSYGFDLSFTKRPAPVFTNQEKFLAFPEYVTWQLRKANSECEILDPNLKWWAISSQLKPIRAHFPFAWTRSRVLMKRAGQIVLPRIAKFIGDLLTERLLVRNSSLARSIRRRISIPCGEIPKSLRKRCRSES